MRTASAGCGVRMLSAASACVGALSRDVGAGSWVSGVAMGRILSAMGLSQGGEKSIEVYENVQAAVRRAAAGLRRISAKVAKSGLLSAFCASGYTY
jgi:hypothetical protein